MRQVEDPLVERLAEAGIEPEAADSVVESVVHVIAERLTSEEAWDLAQGLTPRMGAALTLASGPSRAGVAEVRARVAWETGLPMPQAREVMRLVLRQLADDHDAARGPLPAAIRELMDERDAASGRHAGVVANAGASEHGSSGEGGGSPDAFVSDPGWRPEGAAHVPDWTLKLQRPGL